MQIKDLKFVRLTVPSNAWLIPVRFIEQAKDKEWTTEKFFKFAPLLIGNPLNVIGTFVDDKRQPKGFLWVSVNVMTEQMDVILLSVDKDYQDTKGTVMKECLNLIKSFPENPEIKKTCKTFGINLKEKIRITTTHPKPYERRGWKRSNVVVMEM